MSGGRDDSASRLGPTLDGLGDPRLAIDNAKEGRPSVHRLRRAQEQVAPGFQGVVQRGEQLVLDVALQVDEQVSARHEVEAREGRVLQHTVGGEHYEVASFLLDPVVVAFAGEEALQALLADVGLDDCGIAAFPRRRQRARIQIGGEDLDVGYRFASRGLLQQQDGYGIGFLAGGAAGDPHADRLAVILPLEQFGDDVFGERDEGVVVAEESGHRDEQVVEQSLRLLDVVAKIGEIVFEAFTAVDLHAAHQAAHDRRPLVAGEVVLGASAQIRKDAADDVLRAFLVLLKVEALLAVDELGELAREVGHRHDDVGAARGDRAARHGAVFGLVGVLYENDAARLLHGANADRAVRAAARQNDREAVSVLRRERTEEQVDGRPKPSRLVERRRRDLTPVDAQLPIGSDYVDAIRLQRHRLADLVDRHAGATPEN